ncbi:MAG: hypothetical protein JWM91_2614 [Rhodospirillales bacterium]|nr:hypothetical protein [Rhodospirillales bacterium]
MTPVYWSHVGTKEPAEPMGGLTFSPPSAPVGCGDPSMGARKADYNPMRNMG